MAICDAGLKAITFEPRRPLPPVKGLDGVVYERASEEHGRLKVETDSGLKIRDKIEVVVSHCCTNVNLYDFFHCVRNDSLEAVWRISARGKSH